ncbi:hypothetical protein PGTUg99_026537 [Puccinia graminis f. sp. tritici]|uniref:Uncharacterized protein n=1 Tax=Puccinia graminis f. sp. tritici TaxID=56615 RepID=A0A5B0RTH0_PUCGR|nr:hypothetical protein PGTUg99_026537 [Puccinia graminis f. sp. tritici]
MDPPADNNAAITDIQHADSTYPSLPLLHSSQRIAIVISSESAFLIFRVRKTLFGICSPQSKPLGIGSGYL